ncbi:unnamed protein product [Chironomus riparius]|uniref:Serine hydrolase domain-containing protein n=1 Tax=Chironomus riparius TaxID=315576 RepID=A0A9N9S5Z9_9DIPT|nr:unnamed protein product [Chironomus riparius]
MGKNKLKIQDADKLNILCLHGYRQNGDGFRSKTGSFRKFVKNYANFTYITADHFAKPLNEGDEIDENQRSWWFNKEDGSFKGTNENSAPAVGFQESIKLVEKVWNEGNYQGILGFSQGASFVSLICSMSERNLTSIKPRFAVLTAGFRSGSLVHRGCYENKITIPSLHVYGMNDEIIPNTYSEKLRDAFEAPQFITHEGGHYFPATANEKQTYVSFFQDQLQSYLEDREMKVNGVATQNDEEEDEVES